MKKKPILYLTKHEDSYSADGDHPEAQTMFQHLVGDEYSTYDLSAVKLLAKLHGWTVKIRDIRQDELDTEGW